MSLTFISSKAINPSVQRRNNGGMEMLDERNDDAVVSQADGGAQDDFGNDMIAKPYVASLSKSQGRAGWSVIFRHPVRIDEATGKTGVRVRQGLGTRDEAEAKQLLNQLNDLLDRKS